MFDDLEAAFAAIDAQPGMTPMEKQRAKSRLQGLADAGFKIIPSGRGVAQSSAFSG